tara:strand:+ start:700 stop:1026 length:327 start_codon:yes stop_codon:yes gene_type:complete
MSKGEATLAILLRHYKLPFKREYKFHPSRKWRFDFAIGEDPSQFLLAVEIEGGVHSGGRHTRGKGYTDDLIKYNAALLAGWRVLRYTTPQVDAQIIEDIKHLMNGPLV